MTLWKEVTTKTIQISQFIHFQLRENTSGTDVLILLCYLAGFVCIVYCTKNSLLVPLCGRMSEVVFSNSWSWWIEAMVGQHLKVRP